MNLDINLVNDKYVAIEMSVKKGFKGGIDLLYNIFRDDTFIESGLTVTKAKNGRKIRVVIDYELNGIPKEEACSFAKGLLDELMGDLKDCLDKEC